MTFMRRRMQEDEIRLCCGIVHDRKFSQTVAANGEAEVSKAAKQRNNLIRVIVKPCRPLAEHLRENCGSLGSKCFQSAAEHEELSPLNVAFDSVDTKTLLDHHII